MSKELKPLLIKDLKLDPSKHLKEMLQIANRIQEGGYGRLETRLAELVIELDCWLENGWALPTQWTHQGRIEKFNELADTGPKKFGNLEMALLKSLSESAKPTTDKVIPYAKRLFEVYPTGGPLHIVLDDGNLDTETIHFCITLAETQKDLFCMYLGKCLLKMSDTQRRKVYRATAKR